MMMMTLVIRLFGLGIAPPNGLKRAACDSCHDITGREIAPSFYI
jgi:hypothetical protein